MYSLKQKCFLNKNFVRSYDNRDFFQVTANLYLKILKSAKNYNKLFGSFLYELVLKNIKLLWI